MTAYEENLITGAAAPKSAAAPSALYIVKRQTGKICGFSRSANKIIILLKIARA